MVRAKAYLGRAKAAEFTAVVLANTKWLALPGRAGAEYSARLKSLGDEAARLGIGLVPMVTNFGDGAALLFHEPALTEGMPVRDALFVVRGRQAELQPDPPLELRNPGFEATDDGRPAGWTDERIEDPRLGRLHAYGEYSFTHAPPPIRLTVESRLREGQRLRVSFYHAAAVYGSQVSICLSAITIRSMGPKTRRSVMAPAASVRWLACCPNSLSTFIPPTRTGCG